MSLQLTKRKNVPGKLFIDSTALWGSNVFDKPEFTELRELAELLGVELYVTEINFEEFRRHRQREYNSLRGKLRDANQAFHTYGLDSKSVKQCLAVIDQFDLNKHLKTKMTGNGLKVIPFQDVSTTRLLRMSIEGIPPFDQLSDKPGERSSEKGFRDALIMFNVLMHLKEEAPNSAAIVVTNDSRLSKGFEQHADEFAAVVDCVEKLEDATAILNHHITEAVKKIRRQEREQAKGLLEDNLSAIEQKISEVRQISSMELGGLFSTVKAEDGRSLSVRSVESLRLASIESAIWKKSDTDQKRTVVFKLKCIAEIVAEVQQPLFGLSVPQFTIGSPPQPGFLVSQFGKPSLPEMVKTTTPVTFYGRASFTVKGKTATLEEVSIAPTLPDQEDFVTLNWEPS